MLNPDITKIKAFAPATCANVAVGFDIMGFTLQEPGDEVTLTLRDDAELVITAIEGVDELSMVVEENCVTASMLAMRAHLHLNTGFDVHIKKGIPLSSGMGGSAASAAAGIVALNGFLQNPLSTEDLIQFALVGEQVASGALHGDNVVPCLLGGWTLAHSLDPIDIVALPLLDLHYAIVHPDIQVDTRKGREVLPVQLPLIDYVEQSANLSGVIAALYTNDVALLRRSLKDVLIEPYRAELIRGFGNIVSAARLNNAVGFGISGSGPSIFALAENLADAKRVVQAMSQAFEDEHVQAQSWVGPLTTQAAHIVKQE